MGRARAAVISYTAKKKIPCGKLLGDYMSTHAHTAHTHAHIIYLVQEVYNDSTKVTRYTLLYHINMTCHFSK